MPIRETPRCLQGVQRFRLAYPPESARPLQDTKLERAMMPKTKSAAWYTWAACSGLAPMFDTGGLTADNFTRPRSKPLSKVAEEKRELYATQIGVCRTCPVKTECLADAYEWETRPEQTGKYAGSVPTAAQIAKNTLGIRGGLTPAERLIHYYALCRVRNPYTSVQEDCVNWVETRNNPKLTGFIARKETRKNEQ